MKAKEFITEGLNHPIICVDVQPEYSGMNDGDENSVFPEIINFVNKQTGPVLMFVNAEDQGLSGDTIQSIKQYWDDTICPEDERYTYNDETEEHDENPNCPKINWQRFAIADKGYGYFRSWMDHGIEPATIVATIRELYQQKKSDSRELQFPAFNKRTPQQSLIMGAMQEMEDDPISVNWTSVSQLKRFNGAYIVGGARDQCLREVELLMNAFNIKYKRIDSLIYEGQQGVVEDRPIPKAESGKAVALSNLGKFHAGVDTLGKWVPERLTHQFALDPNKWEHTFYSLTLKEPKKIRYYRPKNVDIVPGTLVGDMAIANQFYRTKDPAEQEQYALAYLASLKPYPVNLDDYEFPELLIPRKEQGVAEGLEQQYLWHGSRQKIPMLEPRQSVDTGGAVGSNQNAIYATSDPKVAIAMGLTTPGSDTGMFPNDPQMVLFSGKIRKGENVYLHKVPMNGPDGKPQFVQGGNSREFHSVSGVEVIKPTEIKAVPVDKYLNLIRQATQQDLELRKKYMKQGVAEGLQNIEIQDDKSIVTISVGGKERFVLQPATGHKPKSYGGGAYKYWTIYDRERKKDRFNPKIGMMSKNQAIAYVNKIIKHEEDAAKVKPGVAEGTEKVNPLTNAVISFYKPVVDQIEPGAVDDYVKQAKELLNQAPDPTIRSRMLEIFRKGQKDPMIQGGVITAIAAILTGGLLSSASRMGLSPAQTNILLQAVLNTVIPTIIARINNKSWTDTIKYTLASVGVGMTAAATLSEKRVTEGLSIDVPNEEWLQDKIDYAKRKGRDEWGAPFFGSTTAYVRPNPQVSVVRLEMLKGMRNEQNNVRKKDLEWLMAYMEKTGKLPPDPHGNEYAPFVMVAYNGEAWVNEGNHRIMAAFRLGWKKMPIEIKYFDGGERVESGIMYPKKIGL